MADPFDSLDPAVQDKIFSGEPLDAADPARSSLASAVGQNPDDVAKTVALAKQTGLPQDVIARNRAAVEHQAAFDSLDPDMIFSEAPEAKKWLEDRTNAALIIDEPGSIGALKRNLRDIPRAFEQGLDRNKMIDLYAQKLHTNDLTPDQQAEADAYFQSMDGKQFGTGGLVSQGIQTTVNFAPQMGMQYLRSAEGAAVGGTVGGAGGAAAGLAGGPFAEVTVPIGFATGVRTGAKAGWTAGSLYENYRQNAALAYADLDHIQDDQGNKLDPDVARGAAFAVGVFSAPLDAYALGKVADVTPGVSQLKGLLTRQGIKQVLANEGMKAAMANIGKKLATGVSVNALAGAAQQAVSILGEEYAKQASEGNFKPTTGGEALERIGEGAKTGALVAGTLGVAHSAIEVPMTMRQRSYTPDEVAMHVDQVNDAVRTSKLYQRSPDRFNALVNDLAPDEKFYVNAEEAQKMIGSLTPDQQGALFNAVPDLPKELETAVHTGADISIRKADYASFLAPYPQSDMLRDHIKLDPADTSVAERQAQAEYLKAHPDEAQLIADSAKQLPGDATPEEMYPAIERIVRKSLQDSGRQPVEARALSTLFARTLSRAAAPFGQQAVDVLNKGLLQFQTVDENGQPIKRGSNFTVLLDDLQKVKSGEKLRGADEHMHNAVADFGAKLDAAGLTVEQAKAMEPKALLDAIYPRTEQQQLDLGDQTITLPEVKLDENGNVIVDNTGETNAATRDLLEQRLQNTEAPTVPLEGETNILQQAAYHGSPHKFDKFTLDHIGKGEGNQAFGWGLYFAGDRKVAEYYKDRLGPTEIYRGDKRLDYSKMHEEIEDFARAVNIPEDHVGEFFSMVRSWQEFSDAGQTLTDYITGYTGRLFKLTDAERADMLKMAAHLPDVELRKEGQLYKVDIPEPETMLDWDAPISKQSPHVREALRKAGIDVDEKALGEFDNALLDALHTDQPVTLPKQPRDMTGAEIYKEMQYMTNAHRYGIPARDPKAASQFLHSLGINGIKYFDGNSRAKSDGERNYVVFDDKAIKTLETYNQNENSIERGNITFEQGLRNVVTAFTQSSNFSTGAHEFSHWAVAVNREFAKLAKEEIAKGNANDEIHRINDDWEALKKEVGATDDKFTVDQEEHVARMFEQYMREGNAPSEKLRTIFARFRDWLTKIYKDTKELGQPINDETRGIFDRWIASESEIAKVRDRNSKLAEIAKNLGLPDAIATKIADYVNSATTSAEDILYRQLAREQKRVETQAYKDEFAAMRKGVAEELAQKKEYTLIQYMKDNGFKILEGPETLGVDDKILSGSDGENVIHPDSIADLFGYDSGMDMLRALKATSDFDRAADAETRRRLLDKYPDMIAQGRITNKAVAAIMNDRVVLALDLMIKELGRAHGDLSRVGMKQYAKAIAQQQVADMRMGDANYSFRYDVARETELKNALKASRAGDPNKAMIHLQKAMVNQTIYKSLEEFKDVRDKAAQLFKKVDAKDKDLAPSKDIDFIGAARFILYKYGLGGENFDINNWLSDIQERQPDVMSDLIGLAQMVSAPAKAAKDLTVSEFMDVYNSVKNIYATARSMREFEIEGKKMRTEQAVGELLSQMGDVTAALHEGTQLTTLNKFRNNLSSAKAALRRVESWTKAMDGAEDGPFRKYIWKQANMAEDGYKFEREKWMQGYRDILVKYKDLLGQKGSVDTNLIKTDILGRQARLRFRDKLEVIGFMLHTGNESNLDKLLGGYGIDRGAFHDEMLRLEKTGVIGKDDWRLTQELWDYAESLKPIAQRAHKKLYGYRFDEIEASPIKSTHGVFRGGYWPAVVDGEQAANNKSVEQTMEQARQYMLATTGKGFTKGRVDNYRQPLKTDLRLGSQHIDKVLRFAHLEPATRDIARIVNRHEFKDKLKAIDFDAMDGMLMPWLQRFAQQTMEPPTAAGDRSAAMGRRLVAFMRSAAVSQIIRYNPVVALQNIANLPVAAHLVDKRELARSFAKVTMNPLQSYADMKVASKEMSNRMSINGVRVMQQIDQIAGRKGKFTKTRDFMLAYGPIFMHAVDGYLSPIVWHAAYNEALGKGKTDVDAVQHADRVIREVMGAGGSKDVSKIEASSPLMKAIMPFYSYFNAQGNLIGSEFGNIMRKHGWNGTPKMFMAYISLIAAPAILSDVITGSLRGQLPTDADNDGDVLDDWLAYITGSQLKYAAATVPLAGQGVNAVMNALKGKPIDDRMSISPIVSGALTAGRGGVGLYKWANGDEVDDTRLIRDVMSGVGFVTNLPLGQAAKPISYMTGVAEGTINPEGPGDVAQGLIAGPPPKR